MIHFVVIKNVLGLHFWTKMIKILVHFFSEDNDQNFLLIFENFGYMNLFDLIVIININN